MRSASSRAPRVAALATALLFLACSSNETTPGGQVPAALSIVGGNAQSAPAGTELPDALVARVVDAQQQPISGQLVNFRVVSGGGSVFAGSAISNAQGIVRERWTLGTSTAVEQRVEARAVDNETGAPLVFAEFTATATPGPAASMSISQGDRQSGRVLSTLPESLAVLVRDQYDNPVSGAHVSWTVQTDAGAISPNPSTAGADGIARAAWTLGPRGGPVTATASVGAASTGFGATATGGAAARIETWSGDGQAGTVGETLALRLTALVRDAYGNPVGAGAPVQWIAADTSARLGPVDAATDSNGYARATWNLGLRPGTQVLRAIAANDTASFSAAGRAMQVDFHDGCALVAMAAYCFDGSMTRMVAVGGGLQFRDLSADNGSYCGVTNDDVAYCWGTLHGRTTPPFDQPGVTKTGVRDVSMGSLHACLLALNGRPWCWGFNDNGQLGDSTQLDKGVPIPVHDTIDVFTQLALGTRLTCGLTTQREVLCWGSNLGGVLGTNAIGGQRSTTPIKAAPGWNFTEIAVGYSFVCALTNAGQAYCWGSNTFGTLGDGTTTDRAAPAPVAGNLTFTRIFARGYTSACGLTSASVLYCWGDNRWGQLGDGTTEQRNVPTPFRAGISPTSVAPSIATCGIAGGYLYCWGYRDNAPHPRPWGIPPP